MQNLAIIDGNSSCTRCTRRTFVRVGVGSVGLLAWLDEFAAGFAGRELPLVDYHAHPSDDVPIEKQVEEAARRGVKLGIVEHAGKPGHNYPHLITSDEALRAWIRRLQPLPVYKGVQAEGLDWPEAFSKQAVAELDYVLSDALTLPEPDGTFTEIWRPWVRVDNKQKWMDRYVDFHVEVLEREPIDILANPLFLPECIRADFDMLWTERRMRRIIDAAVKNRVAIEINSRYQLPGERFLRMAKEAGLKFSFGSNLRGLETGRIEYSVEMARKLGLGPDDLFRPAPRGRKPIEVRSS